MTPMQQLMLADGCPADFLISAEERAAAWKGKRTRSIAEFSLKPEAKPTDPGTIALLKEREAARKAAAQAAKQARREAAIIRQRQRASRNKASR